MDTVCISKSDFNKLAETIERILARNVVLRVDFWTGVGA